MAWLGLVLYFLPYQAEWVNRLQASLAMVFVTGCVAALLDLNVASANDNAAVIVFFCLLPTSAFAGWALARMRLFVLGNNDGRTGGSSSSGGGSSSGDGCFGRRGGAPSNPFAVELKVRYLLSPDNLDNHPAFHFPGFENAVGGNYLQRQQSTLHRLVSSTQQQYNLTSNVGANGDPAGGKQPQ